MIDKRKWLRLELRSPVPSLWPVRALGEDRNQGWENAGWRKGLKMGLFGGLATTVVTKIFFTTTTYLKLK
jgi:hypothetical protein